MDVLLTKSFTFTTEDARRNVLLPFYVEKPYDRMIIKLRYGPKEIRDPEIIRPQIEACVQAYFPEGHTLTEEDLKEYEALYNFVTLSVDYNNTYIGCAHRHDPEQSIILSAHSSSWGFTPISVNAGQWRIVLHVQAVVAGAVKYNIAAFGLKGGENDAALPAI